MIASELEKLKVILEDNHRANMAVVQGLLSKVREDAARPVTPLIRLPPLEERMSHIIERVITGCTGNFNISSIARKYSETTGKRATENVRGEISDCINKLRHRNPPEIDVVVEGKGSRSGVYKMRKESVLVS